MHRQQLCSSRLPSRMALAPRSLSSPPAAMPVRAAAFRHGQSAVGPTHWEQQPTQAAATILTADTIDTASTDEEEQVEVAAAEATEAAAASTAAAGRNSGTFRFWHDERRFKGAGERCLVQQALFSAGGVRTGGYPKTAPCPGPLGWQRTSDWDLLWSPARTALKAASTLRAGQLISAMPGMFCITKKRRLSVTLQAAYGEGAWAIMPLTFSLPAQLPAWAEWLEAQAAAGADPGPWILKTTQHLGQGLALLEGEAAYRMARTPRPAAAKPFVVGQRYVTDPLLVQGRKFGIRLWVLVTSVTPLRAYVHSRGLVLFSTHSYDAESLSDTDRAVGLGHVTNYAQNAHGLVWDLEALEQHLGQAAWQRLWGTMVSHAAKVVAAGLGELRQEAANLKLNPTSTFELLGLDFLVDTSLHPWLLEVNGTPSLAVDHADPATAELIHTQKAGMVNDMVNMLDCTARFAPRYQIMKEASAAATSAAAGGGITGQGSGSAGAGLRSNASKQRVAKLKQRLVGKDPAAQERTLHAELAAAGGFVPLMPHLPLQGAAAEACGVVFSAADHLLAQQMQAWSSRQQEGSAAAQQQQQQHSMGQQDGQVHQHAKDVPATAAVQQQQQQQPPATEGPGRPSSGSSGSSTEVAGLKQPQAVKGRRGSKRSKVS